MIIATITISERGVHRAYGIQDAFSQRNPHGSLRKPKHSKFEARYRPACEPRRQAPRNPRSSKVKANVVEGAGFMMGTIRLAVVRRAKRVVEAAEGHTILVSSGAGRVESTSELAGGERLKQSGVTISASKGVLEPHIHPQTKMETHIYILMVPIYPHI